MAKKTSLSKAKAKERALTEETPAVADVSVKTKENVEETPTTARAKVTKKISKPIGKRSTDNIPVTKLGNRVIFRG